MPRIDLTNAHKIVGGRLRLIREATTKSIIEAATEAGITSKMLSKIEDGEVDFNILTLGRLCKVYHISAEKVLEGLTENGAGKLQKR
jgi:transcriptional regulator with XRE-family HTH domain